MNVERAQKILERRCAAKVQLLPSRGAKVKRSKWAARLGPEKLRSRDEILLWMLGGAISNGTPGEHQKFWSGAARLKFWALRRRRAKKKIASRAVQSRSGNKASSGCDDERYSIIGASENNGIHYFCGSSHYWPLCPSLDPFHYNSGIDSIRHGIY